MANQYPTDSQQKQIVTNWAYFLWLIMSLTSWLSFTACAWLAVWYQEGRWGTFGVFWLVWIVILVAAGGAKKAKNDQR